MVSIRKKEQSNRRLLSQLYHFDQNIIIGSTASERQGTTVVNEGKSDQDLAVGTNLVTHENTVNVKTLERCFIEKIDRELSNFVDKLEHRIQNEILTTIDSILAPKIELAIRSINARSGQDATSVTANS